MKKMSPFWKVNSSVSGIFVYGRMATMRFLSLTGSGGGTVKMHKSADLFLQETLERGFTWNDEALVLQQI